jgi:hypothetical protein
MKFTGNKKGTRIALLIFLLLFLAGALGYCARSEAAEGLSVSLGQPFIGSSRCEYAGLMIAQELADRRWLAHMWTHGDGQCRGEAMRANIGAGIARTTHLGPWALGIGMGLAEHGDRAIGPLVDSEPPRTADRMQLGAVLLIRRHIGERWVIDLHHMSSGGSTHWNPGKNMLLFGVRIP